MKVVWNGDVRVKSVKRESNGEVTVEKRICMKNGRQEGEVSFLVNGVEVFKGCCVDGVPNGQGTMTGQNGESAKGEWRNGELVKGTIRVSKWRTYTMDSMTSHFQYLGGFGQPISGKGNMTVGKRACSGTFENGEMVMGTDYIESTTPGTKWDVKSVFVVNGEKATLHYRVLDNSGKVYDNLVCGSHSIVNKGNGIVEHAFGENGEKVTMTYQCSPQQLEQVFSEESITVDKRFRDVQLVERKTERGEGNVTSHYYYWNHQTIDYLNGLVYNAASGVVYQGDLAMSVEGAVTVPVCSGRGKQYDGNEGLLYDGGWLNGQRSGHGKEYDGNEGLQYNGEWLNGQRSGKGVEYANGKKVYDGEWKNGVRNGHGKEYDDYEGLLYDGWWLNGMRNGEGTEYAGDTAWTGVWKNGKKDGKFSALFKDGMAEEIWSNGMKASSVVTRKDGVKEVRRMVGRKEETVEWNDGERTYRYVNDGKMIVELVNGGKLYVGGVKKNQDSWWKKHPNHRYSKWLYVPDGYGEEYDENGVVAYRGQYWHGYRYYHGEEYVNGVLAFEGRFEYDRRMNGKGMEPYGEYQLKGKWKNGVKDGEFVMNGKNGLVFKTNYEKGDNYNMWSVYDQKTLLYQGSLKDFLPENGNYYVLDDDSLSVPTDAVRKKEKQTIPLESATYSGQFSVENDFYCVVKGEGILYSGGWEYDGVFNTFDYISDCTVKSQGKVVFFGIVRGQQFYAGFRYTNNCTEEGLFENGSLKHGYKLLNGNLFYSVGDPSVYEKAYTSEHMTFRNTRRSIKASTESKDSLKNEDSRTVLSTNRKDQFREEFCKCR
ncbi:hypothetical protein BLSTO_04264 [Blastocystis sp. subtype 1]